MILSILVCYVSDPLLEVLCLLSFFASWLCFSGRLDSDEKSVSARQALFETLTQEIEGLLTKLTHVNDEVSV